METKFSFFFRKTIEKAIFLYENEVEHPPYHKFLWQPIDGDLVSLIYNFPTIEEKTISSFEGMEKYFLSIEYSLNNFDERDYLISFGFLSKISKESQELFLEKLLSFLKIDRVIAIATKWIRRKKVIIFLLNKTQFKVKIAFPTFLDWIDNNPKIRNYRCLLYDKSIGNPLNEDFAVRGTGYYTSMEALTSEFCNIGLKGGSLALGEMMEKFNTSIGIGCSIFARETREHYSPKSLPYLIYSIIHRGEKKGYYSLPDESLSEEEFRRVSDLPVDKSTIRSDRSGYYCIDLNLARGLLTFVRKITRTYSFIHSISRSFSSLREGESVSEKLFSFRENTLPFDKIYDWDVLPITKKTLYFSTTFSEKHISNAESLLLSEKREISFLFEEENATIVEVRVWLFPRSGDDFPDRGESLPDLVLAIMRQDSIFLKWRSDTY